MSQLSRFIPLFDRVLVQRVAQETTTKSGIILPSSAQKAATMADVVAVGTGFRGVDGNTVALPIVVGDSVLLPEFGGQTLTLDDKVCFFLCVCVCFVFIVLIILLLLCVRNMYMHAYKKKTFFLYILCI